MTGKASIIIVLLLIGTLFPMAYVIGGSDEPFQESIPTVRTSVVNNTYHYNVSLSISSSWNKSKLSFGIIFQSMKQTSTRYINDQSRTFNAALSYNSLWVPLNKTRVSTGTRRVVPVEDFTGTWCGYCPGVIGALDRIANDKTYFPKNCTIMEWHSGDSYAYSGSNARVSFYGVRAFPTVIVDGVVGRVGGSTSANNTQIDAAIKSMINGRLNVPPIAKIDAFAGKTNTSAWVNVTITMLRNPDYYRAKVYFVLMEDLYPKKHNGGYMRYTPRADTTRTITFPNDKPRITILSPVGGTTYSDNLEIRWNAVDNESAPGSLKIKIEYQKAGGSWTVIQNSYGNSGSYNWNTKSVPDGDYRIRLTVTDPWNGVSSAVSDWFTILNPDPPTVSLFTPNGGEVLTGVYTVVWSASDDEDPSEKLNVSLYYRRGVYGSWVPIVENITNEGHYDWDTMNPRVPDGTNYRLKVVVWDSDNMSASVESATDFSIQNPDPPTVSMVYPEGGERLSGVINVLWSASDDEDSPSSLKISLYLSQDGGENWQTLLSDAANTGNYALDTTKYDDGNNYRLKVIVKDSDRMTAEALSGNFTILNNDPPAVHFTSPRDGETVSGEVTIKWVATDEEEPSENLNVTLYYLHMGKKTYLLQNVRNPGQFVWDTSEVEDGNYIFTVVARDSYEEESPADQLTLHVYNPDPPHLSDFYTSTEKVRNSVTLYWSAEDPDMDDLTVELYWKETTSSMWNLITLSEDAVGNYEWDVSDLPEGTYMLKAVVKDVTNLTDERYANITIERPDPPAVSITSPDGGEYNNLVTVAWEASDPDGDSLTYTLKYSSDGNVWLTIVVDLTDTQYIWNVSQVPEGRYRIKVIAKDSSPSHLTAEATSREFIIRHPAPPSNENNTPQETPKDHPEGGGGLKRSCTLYPHRRFGYRGYSGCSPLLLHEKEKR
ncbi:MAG: hypothetical protein J7L88_01415 [Thermoplasmata archaeon]|nr:hypothetical protein [Thermoplasmata archaeon]